MPKHSAPFQPGGSSPSLVVEVAKYPIDWDSNRELEELAGDRFSALGELILRGAWFLTPTCTVHAHSPSPTFFRAALKARGRWLFAVRHTLRNRGLRDQARAAEDRGRRVAYLDILSVDTAKRRLPEPGESIRLADLPRDQRAKVLFSGRIAKQFAISGIMIIDGNHIPPRTWQAQADQVLHPHRPRMHLRRRRVDLTTLKATHDLEPLKLISLEALQAHLDQHPDQAVFVTPHATFSAPSITPTFYDEAKKLKAGWHHLLARTLGSGPLRRLRKAADPATLTLALDGTLMVGDRIYLPGLWPTLTFQPQDPDVTRSQEPSVPLSFSGLTVTNDDTDHDMKTEDSEGAEPSESAPA